MKFFKYFISLLMLIMSCSNLFAQDSISLFQNLNNQYNFERDFKVKMYYNPANMLDYSAFSSSELFLNYHSQNNKIYRKQYGSDSEGIKISTNSFQKIKDNKVLWGNASYQSTKTKKITFNENLDFDRIAPYVSADSIGGDLKVENYHFLGGYSQRNNKFSFGGQVSYDAKLGARARDPRINNVTSELNFKLGVNYEVYRKLKISLFTEAGKYIQNNKLRFASKIGQPLVYQMTGLGFYNSLFSGGTTSLTTIFEESSYKYGGEISNKNGNDFYLLVQSGQSSLLKSYKGSGNRFYNVSDLDKNFLELEAAKFLHFTKHTIGLKINHKYSKTLGKEYGYTNNTQLKEQIFKRLSYSKSEESNTLSLFYSYKNQDNLSLSFLPYYSFYNIKEQRVNPYSGQKFDYSVIGFIINYRQKINKNSVVSIKPYYDFKSVQSAKERLAAHNIININNWIINDFNYLASDIKTIGASLRYDFKLKKIPALFVEADISQTEIQSKINNYSTVSVGLTF